MLSVDDAMEICREFAAFSGDPMLSQAEEIMSASVERLLVELQIARDESEHYRALLNQWGIPSKRRKAKKLERKGFEFGWE